MALKSCNRGPEAGCSGREHLQSWSLCIPNRTIARRCEHRQETRFDGRWSGTVCFASTDTAQDSAIQKDVLQSAIRRTYPQPPEAVEARSTDARPLEEALEGALAEGCEGHTARRLNVAVLLSGGVDSSLALHLLKQAGHNVTAFYLKIWFQEDFENFWGACPWEEDLEICQQVCDKLDVRLEVVPLTQEYWQRVVEDSIANIKDGRTPNPDILCNSRVKFGAFYDHLQSKQEGNFDRVASGHYARLVRGGVDDKPVRLALTPDAVKDQTYFLANLSQGQLSRAMFPLGSLTKAEVRQLAAAAGLPNQARRDSQGICFLGKVRFEEFVQSHLGRWPGPLVDDDTHQVVGFHEGYWFYTPGQRKGIFLSGGPWYVSRKDCRRNVVYISRQYYVPEKLRATFRCGGFNWIAGNAPPMGRLQCKVRHGPHIYECNFQLDAATGEATVNLEGNDQGLAPGQYAVFYQDGTCLGSSVILPSPSKTVEEPSLESDAVMAERLIDPDVVSKSHM